MTIAVAARGLDVEIQAAMALDALQGLVVVVEQLPGQFMVEWLGRLAVFVVVALGAGLALVTGHAWAMGVAPGGGGFDGAVDAVLGGCVAVAVGAGVALVAVNATDAVTLDVLNVAKEDMLAGGGSEASDKTFVGRRGDGRMHAADDVAGRGGMFSRGVGVSGRVTDDAVVVATPILVAVEALAVVGAFEAGDLDVGGVAFNRVTGPALGDLGGAGLLVGVDGGVGVGVGLLMVAGDAAVAHVGHASVAGVVEGDGFIFVFELVEQDDVGPSGCGFVAVDGCDERGGDGCDEQGEQPGALPWLLMPNANAE